MEQRKPFCLLGAIAGDVIGSVYDFEDAIRKAVSLGGDADTLAAITGSIAEAFYGDVPETIAMEVWKRVPEKMQDIVEKFSRKYSKYKNIHHE